MYNLIDLFCGCGGLSAGFQMAGYNTILGLDNDKEALKSFKNNHVDANIVCGDITKIPSSEIMGITKKDIDIVIGGPPCQGMSISGPRKLHDPRNRLYLSFIRVVADLQPKAFVVENVPGLVGLFNGIIKDSIVSEFNSMGYTVNYKIINAADFGVPQIRKRVFFVGLRGSKTYLFPKGTHNGENLWVTAEQAVSDLPLLEDTLGNEIEHYVSEPQNEYQEYCRKNSSVIYNHQATSHTEKTKNIISLVPEGCNYKELPIEYIDTRNFHVAWTRYHSKKPASTIDTGHRHHFHFKCNRVPTVRENARFQSFPDDFVFSGNRTEQYRQVGNAVPPLLAKAIAEELLKYL